MGRGNRDNGNGNLNNFNKQKSGSSSSSSSSIIDDSNIFNDDMRQLINMYKQNFDNKAKQLKSLTSNVNNMETIRKSFSPIANAAENYFKKVMNDGLNTFTIDKLVTAINEAIDSRNKYTVKIINSISSGRDDNRNKQKRRDYKRKIATILMLALKVVGSQKELKNFKSFMDTIFISYGASKQLRMYLREFGLGSRKNRAQVLQMLNQQAAKHQLPGYCIADNKQVTRHSKKSYIGDGKPTYFLHGLETIVETLQVEFDVDKHSRKDKDDIDGDWYEICELDEDKNVYKQIIENMLVRVKKAYAIEKKLLLGSSSSSSVSTNSNSNNNENFSGGKSKAGKRSAEVIDSNNDKASSVKKRKMQHQNEDDNNLNDDHLNFNNMPAIQRNITMITYSGNISSSDGLEQAFSAFLNRLFDADTVADNGDDNNADNSANVSNTSNSTSMFADVIKSANVDVGLLVLDGKANIDYRSFIQNLAKKAETELNDGNVKFYNLWLKFISLQVVPGDLHQHFYLLHCSFVFDYGDILEPLRHLIQRWRIGNTSETIVAAYRAHRDFYIMAGKASIYAKLARGEVDYNDLNNFERRCLFFIGTLVAVKENDGILYSKANGILLRLFVASGCHPTYVKICIWVFEFLKLHGSKFATDQFLYNRFIYLTGTNIARDTFIEFKNYLDKQIGINTDEDFLLVANAAWRLYKLRNLFNNNDGSGNKGNGSFKIFLTRKTNFVDLKAMFDAFSSSVDEQNLWPYVEKKLQSNNTAEATDTKAEEDKAFRIQLNKEIGYGNEDNEEEEHDVQNKKKKTKKATVPQKKVKRKDIDIFSDAINDLIKKQFNKRKYFLKKEKIQKNATMKAFSAFQNNNQERATIKLPSNEATKKLQEFQQSIEKLNMPQYVSSSSSSSSSSDDESEEDDGDEDDERDDEENNEEVYINYATGSFSQVDSLGMGSGDSKEDSQQSVPSPPRQSTTTTSTTTTSTTNTPTTNTSTTNTLTTTAIVSP